MSDHIPWELRRHDECHRVRDELLAKIVEQAETIRKLREELVHKSEADPVREAARSGGC